MKLIKLIKYVWLHKLNAHRRLAAVGRLLRWQISSRLLTGPIALQFVEGTQLFASRGMTGATGNWYCGLHEAEEMGFVLHFLRSDDLFMDVGANIGSYTVLGAGAVGAHVVSVEPIPSTFSSLQTNVILNGLAGLVELHRVGLSSERSELRFTADEDTVNHVMAEGELGPSIRVPVVCMDELLAGAVPKIIKIDVEGYERSVLLGGKNTLSNSQVAAVIMEINGSGERYGIEDHELLSIMDGHGFKPYSYNPLTRSLAAWNEKNGNAIFLRNPDAVSSKLKRAKTFKLVNGSI